MKRRLFTYAIVPAVLGLVLLGTGVASARWFGGMGQTPSPDEIAAHHATMFEQQAQLLGVSVDDVKNGWAQGKNLKQIAEERGITAEQLQQKMKDARDAQMKSHLQALVDKGVITQAQADARISAMGDKAGMRMRGIGGMRGWK